MTKAADLMHTIHGTDIYAGFVPTFPLDLQGWNSDHPAFHEIMWRDRPEIVIDVGVWKGASSIGLARMLKAAEIDGAVISVDTFLGGYDTWQIEPQWFNLIPRLHGRPMLYEQFMANVVRSEVQDTIIPLARTSHLAATLLERSGIRAGLIHIDASHEYTDVLDDARRYWRILAPGGYLIGDDYSPSWPGVVQAADEFAREAGQELTIREPKWILRKA